MRQPLLMVIVQTFLTLQIQALLFVHLPVGSFPIDLCFPWMCLILSRYLLVHVMEHECRQLCFSFSSVVVLFRLAGALYSSFLANYFHKIYHSNTLSLVFIFFTSTMR